MLKWLLTKQIDAFDRDYGYDSSYVREILSADLTGNTQAMSEEVLLAYRFAHAVLAHDPQANPLRERIVAKWGKKGLISLGFALTMARFFPTLKYALGNGQACTRVKVSSTPVAVNRQEPQVAR